MGILLLGAGLTQWAGDISYASSAGPQSASVEYSGIDESLGVLSGGRQRDFVTGHFGWQGDAFSALGTLGIEWTTALGAEARRGISPGPGSASVSPGGESTWNTTGYLNANPNNQIYTENTVRISGNQVRFSMRHRSFSDESAINRRIYWVASLASGYNPVFSGAGTSSVLITDASGSHPTLILSATSQVGEPVFQGSASLYTPLVDGDTSPTLYLVPGSATDFTMEVTVGIVDADPCAQGAASTFASANAGVYGAIWESRTACAEPAAWTITSDGEPSEPLTVTFAAPYQAPVAPATRTLSLSGLPAGVTWERAEDNGTSLQVVVTASPEVEAGTYSLGWSTLVQTESGGVTTLSRPSASTATLTIEAPPPVIEPQPVAVSPPAPAGESSPTPEPSTEQGSAVDPPAVIRNEPLDQPLVPDTPSATPMAPAAEEEPSTLSLERVPRRASAFSPDIPEPMGAAVWPLVGTGLLASGGIIAAVRRRWRRRAEEDTDGSNGIN